MFQNNGYLFLFEVNLTKHLFYPLEINYLRITLIDDLGFFIVIKYNWSLETGERTLLLK